MSAGVVDEVSLVVVELAVETGSVDTEEGNIRKFGSMWPLCQHFDIKVRNMQKIIEFLNNGCLGRQYTDLMALPRK